MREGMREPGPDGLPPIEEWWPALSIEARHAVLEHLHRPLPKEAREEIARATGRRIAEGTELSRLDIGFIETQQEPVD